MAWLARRADRFERRAARHLRKSVAQLQRRIRTFCVLIFQFCLLIVSSMQSRFGTPWNFVLRDILQFDHNNAEAIARVQKAKRTCSIFVGVG